MATHHHDIGEALKEKTFVDHSEHQRGGLSEEDTDFLNNFPEERRKKIIRKVDVSALLVPSKFLRVVTNSVANCAYVSSLVFDCLS